METILMLFLTTKKSTSKNKERIEKKTILLIVTSIDNRFRTKTAYNKMGNNTIDLIKLLISYSSRESREHLLFTGSFCRGPLLLVEFPVAAVFSHQLLVCAYTGDSTVL